MRRGTTNEKLKKALKKGLEGESGSDYDLSECAATVVHRAVRRLDDDDPDEGGNILSGVFKSIKL